MCCLTMTTAANAAVTLGDPTLDHRYIGDEEHISRACSSTSSCTVMQTTVPGGVTLTAPSDGVIVRWRFNAGSYSTNPVVSLQVVRPAGGGAFAATAESAQEWIPASFVSQTLATRLQISAGDRLGIKILNASGAWILGFAGVNDPAFKAVGFDPALGQTASEPNLPLAVNYEVTAQFNGDFEPDADRDGFGDETQDQCPANPATQSACPPPPATGRRSSALKKCKQKKQKAERAKCRKRAQRQPA